MKMSKLDHASARDLEVDVENQNNIANFVPFEQPMELNLVTQLMKPKAPPKKRLTSKSLGEILDQSDILTNRQVVEIGEAKNHEIQLNDSMEAPFTC